MVYRIVRDVHLGFSVPILPVGGTLQYEPAILRAGSTVFGTVTGDGHEAVRWGPITVMVPTGTLQEATVCCEHAVKPSTRLGQTVVCLRCQEAVLLDSLVCCGGFALSGQQHHNTGCRTCVL